ncbi:MAG: hypothetical protein Q4F21_12500 [Lachnospiraceae bacterium]|nr:hypothetical protein [Lachnospiraceae bacterium]
MADIKRMVLINLRRQIGNSRFYLALLLLLSSMVFSVGNLSEFLSEYNMHVQAGELFIFITSDRMVQFLMVFSFLLLVGDAPFLQEGMDILLMRMSKKRWLSAQILFMFCMITIWLVVLQLCLLLLTAGNISWQNEWSDYITLLGRLAANSVNMETDIIISMTPLKQGSPYIVFGVAFLYSLLLYTYLGLWGLILNLLTGRSYTSLIIAVFVSFRFALFNLAYIPGAEMFSPMNLVDLNVQSINPQMMIYTILFFTIQIMILIWASGKILKKRDICKLR